MGEENLRIAGEKLRELRSREGLSIYKVAKHIHISGNYLSLIERGKRSPSDEILLNIAEYYKVDINEIFDLYNRLPPDNKYNDLNQELRGVITNISIDKRLTSKEKEECIQQILLIAKEIANGRD